MEAAALVLAGVSTAMQVAGTLASGNAAKQAGDYQAAQARQQAGQVRASAQRGALNEQRKTAFALSRAQAVAASSGGDTLDPTVANIEGDISGQGEYNRLSSLFTGEEKARGLEQGATTDEYQGNIDQQASRTKAMGTLAAGGSSMLMKYSNPFSSGGDDLLQPGTILPGASAAGKNISGLPWTYS